MTKQTLDIHEILNYLPQRPPFLFVDKVLSWEKGKNLVAVKSVTMNEPFFVGHFPQRPVMPGVLIVEALAQASTVFAHLSTGEMPSEDAPYLFAGIDNCRFKRMVQPGDQLMLEIELVKHRGPVWVIQGKASVDGELVCSTEMMSVKAPSSRSNPEE